MNRFATGLAGHVRANAIAYLALVCSLGGTSYAALSLPAGSVGSRELRNHSITPVKFDPRGIAGSVRFWASVSAQGKILASSSPAHIVASVIQDQVTWGARFSSRCSGIVTVRNPNVTVPTSSPGFADASVLTAGRHPSIAFVSVYNAAGQPSRQPYVVAVLCP